MRLHRYHHGACASNTASLATRRKRALMQRVIPLPKRRRGARQPDFSACCVLRHGLLQRSATMRERAPKDQRKTYVFLG